VAEVTKTCLNCGGEFQPSATTCPDCGALLVTEEEARRLVANGEKVPRQATDVAPPARARWVIIAAAVVLVGAALIAVVRSKQPTTESRIAAPPTSGRAPGCGQVVAPDGSTADQTNSAAKAQAGELPSTTRIGYWTADAANPKGAIHVSRGDGSDDHAVTGDWEVDNHLKWSRDGSIVLFDSTGPAGTAPGLYSLSLVHGTPPVRLSTSIAESEPTRAAISPDNRRVVFESSDFHTLYIRAVDASDATATLVRSPDVELTTLSDSPSWAPDSTKVVVSTSVGLVVVPTDAGEQKLPPPIVPSAYPSKLAHPDWGTTGSIAYTVDDNTRPEASGVYTVKPDGSVPRQLVHDPVGGGTTNVSWSPDATQIATEVRDGPLAVCVLDINAGTSRVVDSHQGNDFRKPAWSPDGQWLLTANEDSKTFLAQIKAVPVATGSPVPITDDPRIVYAPAWVAPQKR